MRPASLTSLIFAFFLSAASAAAATAPARAAAEGKLEADLPDTGRAVLFADIDGNGKVDPVVLYGDEEGCRLGRLVVEDGTLKLASVTSSGDERLIAPALADADHDGLTDLVSTSGTDVLLRRGLAGGGFAEPVRVAGGRDLLLADHGCSRPHDYVMDVTGDARMELLLPILGGVRVTPASPSPSGSDAPAPIELTVDAGVAPRGSRLSFESPLPSLLATGEGNILLLGPLGGRAVSRLNVAWWSRNSGDGSLTGHRSALVLPAGQTAVLKHFFDLEGDGRPELAVLTAPSRLESFLGEYRLHVFHLSERADQEIGPFFSGKTNINYWQLPTIASRRTAAGPEILLAFYRGLRTAHLNVEIFREDGKGSFKSSPSDFEVGSEQEAERGYLEWLDVDGDGLLDLAGANGQGLVIHRGESEPGRPVSREVSWRAEVKPRARRISMGMASSGEWTLSFSDQRHVFYADLDGDRLDEVIVFGRRDADRASESGAANEGEPPPPRPRVILGRLIAPGK